MAEMRCEATTRSGRPCKNNAKPDGKLCASHEAKKRWEQDFARHTALVHEEREMPYEITDLAIQFVREHAVEEHQGCPTYDALVDAVWRYDRV
jgi:hypothetical protein